jgi:hypothetical protein
MQNPILCRGEVGQLQEVVDTNGVDLDDSHSSYRIFLGRLSWHHQTHYFQAMQLADRHQDERRVETKELHQNSFQYSGRFHMQTLFLQKLMQS